MRWPEKHYIVSEQHRFLYIPIEKVACSTLKSWVITLAEGADTAQRVDPNGHARDHYELHVQPSSLRKLWVADPTMFRFAFVRNPWDRLVSGFLNKFITWKIPAQRFAQEHQRRKRWQRVAGWLTAGWLSSSQDLAVECWRDRLTFREFVARLCETNPARYDLHWRPQHLFLGATRLDFVGRFERLADDFRALSRRLGIPSKLPEKNRTRRDAAVEANLADCPLAELRSLRGFPDYSQFYTPDLRAQVAEIYAEDIRRFGYEFRRPNSASSAASRAA